MPRASHLETTSAGPSVSRSHSHHGPHRRRSGHPRPIFQFPREIPPNLPGQDPSLQVSPSLASVSLALFGTATALLSCSGTQELPSFCRCEHYIFIFFWHNIG